MGAPHQDLRTPVVLEGVATQRPGFLCVCQSSTSVGRSLDGDLSLNGRWMLVERRQRHVVEK